MRCCPLLRFLLLAMMAAVVSCDYASANRPRDRARLLAGIEPPPRPTSFQNIGELNEYLEKLRQYYALLGRPR